MEVSELRIGNLVKIKTSNDAAFYPVYAIDGMGLKVVLGGCRQCEGWKEEKLLKPIPLTEDLLLKYGFEKVGMAYKRDAFIVNRWSDGKLWLGGYGVSLELKSLHQFQNLYFALTSKELEATI